MIISVTLQHNDISNSKNWPESILAVFSRQTCNLTTHALWAELKNRKIPSFVVAMAAVTAVAVDNKGKGLLSVGQMQSTVSLGVVYSPVHT